MPKRYASMTERIKANSRPNPKHVFNGVPCRDWTGSVFPRSDWPDVPREQHYGRIGVRFKAGPRKGQVKSTGAHREAVKASGRRLGSKSPARHYCNRPICVEQLHLRGGTQRQNVRDSIKAGNHKTPFRRGKRDRYTAKRAT